MVIAEALSTTANALNSRYTRTKQRHRMRLPDPAVRADVARRPLQNSMLLACGRLFRWSAANVFFSASVHSSWRMFVP
jgi:hypothetical protein